MLLRFLKRIFIKQKKEFLEIIFGKKIVLEEVLLGLSPLNSIFNEIFIFKGPNLIPFFIIFFSEILSNSY